MSTTDFTITIHLVSSLDGFIAKKDNSISWFESSSYYEKGIIITDEERENFLKGIDCYVMGSRTYEHAVELSKTYGWPYGDVPTFVVSSRKLPVERKNVTLYPGDITNLVNERLRPAFHNVWIAGGPLLAKKLLQLKLADEIRLSFLPILLGEGVPFFDGTGIEQALQLKDVTTYRNGMVELRYLVKK